jgi:hypothetical protein
MEKALAPRGPGVRTRLSNDCGLRACSRRLGALREVLEGVIDVTG